MDRRIKKTEKAVEDAFINLVIDEGYDSIKISEIVEIANVNRSTFYLHYQSLSDILYALENKEAANFAEITKVGHSSLYELLIDFCDQSTKDKRQLQAILSSRGNKFLAKIEVLFKKDFQRLISNYKKSSSESYQYIVKFLIDGFFGSVLKWLENGCKPSKTKFVQTIMDFYFK